MAELKMKKPLTIEAQKEIVCDRYFATEVKVTRRSLADSGAVLVHRVPVDQTYSIDERNESSGSDWRADLGVLREKYPRVDAIYTELIDALAEVWAAEDAATPKS